MANCNNSTAHGKSDWMVPSPQQLLLLYENRTAIGGFGTGKYMSSGSTEFRFCESYLAGYQCYDSYCSSWVQKFKPTLVNFSNGTIIAEALGTASNSYGCSQPLTCCHGGYPTDGQWVPYAFCNNETYYQSGWYIGHCSWGYYSACQAYGYTCNVTYTSIPLRCVRSG